MCGFDNIKSFFLFLPLCWIFWAEDNSQTYNTFVENQMILLIKQRPLYSINSMFEKKLLEWNNSQLSNAYSYLSRCHFHKEKFKIMEFLCPLENHFILRIFSDYLLSIKNAYLSWEFFTCGFAMHMFTVIAIFKVVYQSE